MNAIQIWLMKRYCPGYDERMPEDKPGRFRAEAYVMYGYWGQHLDVVATKEVEGYRQAYITARWLALKAQWRYPDWLYNCGIHYGVNDVNKGEHNEGIPNS